MSPKFKSKVEQFYFENRSHSEQKLNESNGIPTEPSESESETLSPRSTKSKHSMDENLIADARMRAYSGGSRRSYFSFEPGDIKGLSSDM